MTLSRTIVLIAMSIAGLAAQAEPTSPVKIAGGRSSARMGAAVDTYFGIPYAAPPVGLRCARRSRCRHGRACGRRRIFPLPARRLPCGSPILKVKTACT
jgi:hypothetical protein